ncbi:MAG: hypothetical protein OCC45_02135 [Desulfotalea sp.]
MAEIKSTMEMVLERAAQMEKNASSTVVADYSRDGMRLGAAYMNKTDVDIVSLLQNEPSDNQPSIKSGIIQVLLRNIILPRDDDMQATGKKAIGGLISISAGQEQVEAICAELTQILEQYAQHKEQSTEQLESALVNQLQQQQSMNGEEGEANLSATTHPQYATEMSKMLGDLNDQYLQAMDQRKEMLLDSFAS